jgi:hypothetical protein
MARTVNQILAQMIGQKEAETTLQENLTSPSKVAIYSLWIYLIALCISFFEQVLDIYTAAIEDKIVRAGAGTEPWIRDRILEWQSGDNVEYSNGVVAYPIIDTTKNIITRCSVSQGGNKTVNVKVAKSEPPEALTTGEKTELSYYAKQITFAGTQITITSLDADLIYVNADIFYDGQLPEATVKDNVIATMENYCKNLSSVENFDGSIVLPQIEMLLLQTTGVKYVKLNEIASRPSTTIFDNRNILYNLVDGIDQPKTATVSGYLIGETESGYTFEDSFTYAVAV